MENGTVSPGFKTSRLIFVGTDPSRWGSHIQSFAELNSIQHNTHSRRIGKMHGGGTMFQHKSFGWFVIFGLFISVLVASFTGCVGSSPSASVAVTASASTVDGNDSTTLTATVTNDKNSAGVTWSVSGGGTLSNTTTSSATYTAPAPTSNAQSVTVTATSVADTTKSGKATITVPAMPAVTSTSASLAGAVGSAYSVTLQASGGIPPYTWALGSGTTLPTCLTLKSTGVLTTASGSAPTAACAGTYNNIIFKITDSGTATALTTTSSPMTITITAPLITFSPALPAGSVGTAYAGSVAAAGVLGTTTYSLASGALPPDLSLNTSTGAITGTPKAADVGTATFEVTVLDAYGDTATSGSMSIVIAAAPTVTFGSAPAATAKFGVAYASSVTATGGAGPLTYGLASGALPPDLTLSASGAIAGTPKAADIGTFTFAIKAADAFGDSATSGNYTIVVSYPAVTITPGAGSLAFAVTGQSYSQTLTAAGGSGTGFTWTVTGLPANGLTYSGSGATLTISGPATSAGAVNFSATATDSASNSAGPLAYSIQVYSPVTIPATIPASLPSVATVNAAYTGTVAATGGSGNYSWTVTGLSDGLTSSSSGGTLTISGTPTSAATVTASVSVKDTTTGVTSGPYAYAITVYATVTLPTSNPSTLGPAIVSTPYSGTIVAAGGSGNYSWTITGLPSDSLNYSATGGTLTISGTPGSTPTTVSFTAQVTDTTTNLSSGPYNYSVTVYNAVTLNASSLSTTATTNVAYTGSIAASGGSGTGYVWTVTGLSDGLSSASNAGTLTISGTPTSAAAVTFTVSVKDSAGNSAGPTNYTINAYNALTLPSPNPSTLGPATINLPYSGTIVASGGSGNYSWTVTGLPSDSLSDSSSGATLTISGTPGTATSVSFGVTVKDTTTGISVGPFTYTVTVYNGLTLPSPNPATLGPADASSAYSGTIVAAGGSGNYSWTVTGFPADGLNYTTNGATLTISGTPTSAQTVQFTAKVTDTSSNLSAGPFTYSIVVNGPLSLPAPNPASLPSGYTSVAYSGTVNASGGSGTYSWTVTGLPSDNLNYSAAGATLTVSGTPSSTPTTVTFTAKVTDTSTNVSVGPSSYSIAITTPTPVSLPTPNPSSLGPATQNESYNGAINASGGVGPYTWSINGTTVTSGGLSLGNGTLVATSTGGNTLSIGGTPSTTGTVTLTNVKVVDSLNSNATNTYTITVNSQTPLTLPLPSTNPLPQGTINQSYNGYINASGGSGSNYSFTVAVGSGTAQAVPTNGTPLALTDSLSASNTGGNTLSISGTPTAAATVTLAITVTDSANDTASETYTFNIVNPNAGYTVSGTVTYTGSQTGWVYLQLVPSSGCSDCNDRLGTAINATTSGALASGASFTIHGVQPGTYTLQAFMDIVGQGAQNASDPVGSTTNVTVSSANLTGEGIAIANPSAVTLASAPTINGVSTFSSGAFVTVNPLVNGSNIETATSYNLRWSTSSSFGSGVSTQNLAATGANGGKPWIVSGLSAGQTYYFEVQGVAGSSTSPWSSASSGVTIAAPSGANVVTGTVTWTGTATGPLYVGFYDQNTGNVYAAVEGSKTNPPTSGVSYTVDVPTGSNYYFFGVIDQNNDGLIGLGDISNTNGSGSSVAINGSTTMNLALPSASSIVAVRTQSSEQITSGGTSTSYQLDLRDDGVVKLPVAVELTSGPHVVVPADIATGAFGNDDDEFDYWPNINGATPSVGDTYSFNVTYSDGSTGTVTAAVTAVLNAFATLVSPAPLATGASATPNFDWTDPANASSYSYQFQLENSNYNTIWEIPPQHSGSNGFSSSITSITWDVDPTDSGDLPSDSSLFGNATYYWSITSSDSNENSAQVQASFQTAESTLTLPGSSATNALQNTAFSESLYASGGSGSGWVFSVAVGSGTAQSVPTNGTPLALTDGLSATSTGNTLTISGTPTVVETVTLNVSVTDSASHSAGPVTYTINVVSAPSGVNNANLKGTYVCKMNGYYDSNGAQWATLGSFQAAGAPGTLANGIFDSNSRNDTTAVTGTMTGTYAIGSDNNGILILNAVLTSGGSGSQTTQWAVALTNAVSPAQEFTMVESDDLGTNPSGQHGVGNCYLATPSAFTSSTLSGNSFVSSSVGENGEGAPSMSLSRISALNGNITGVADQASAGSSVAEITFTGGSYTPPNATTGRLTVTLTAGSSGSATSAVYLIDANRGFVLDISDQKAQSGDMRKQQQTTYSAANLDGALVFYSDGYEYSNGSVNGYKSNVYQVTGNGSGGITVNQSYDDDGGTYKDGANIGGPFAVTFDSSNPGRATFAPGDSTGYLYFYDNNSALTMGAQNSSGDPSWTGWFEAQSLATFTDAAVTGDYMMSKLPLLEPETNGISGEFDLSSSGNVTAGVTTAGEGDFTYDQSITGTYSWDTAATGTGSFLTAGGASGVSCIVISSTKDACIFDTDSEASVVILQQ